MIHRIKKITLMGLCLIVVLTAAPVPSQAGIVTDAWYALFGPPGSPWFPGLTEGYRTANYYPSAGYSRGYPAYRPFGYSPFTYRPLQAFYAPCSPCGAIGGTCAVSNFASNCAVNYSPQVARIEPTPQQNGDVPETYLPNQNPGSGSKPPSPENEDSNFKKKGQGFGPTRKSETETSEGVNSSDFQEPFLREVQKVPAEAEAPKSAIQKKMPAPSSQPEEVDGKSSPSEESKSKTEESQVEPLNLDHKFVGSSLPKRTRLVIRSRFENFVVVRSKVGPSRNWTLPLQETKLAKN
jgi:hypothetical protein